MMDISGVIIKGSGEKSFCAGGDIVSVYHSKNEPQNNQMNMGPPIPSSGLPEGWTMEQWSYYGSAWLSQQEENLNNTPQISNVVQQEPVNVQDDSVFDLLSNESNTQQKSDPLSAFEDDDLDF